MLPVGTEIDQFGPPTSILTYAARTENSMRSLPPNMLQPPYVMYRVECPLLALQGTAKPWFGLPGGGIGYYFLLPIKDLLAENSLIEL